MNKDNEIDWDALFPGMSAENDVTPQYVSLLDMFRSIRDNFASAGATAEEATMFGRMFVEPIVLSGMMRMLGQ